MLLSAAVAINKLRWTLPATCMVAPSPLFFGFMVMVQTLKPLLPSTVYEYIDECIWSSFQRTVLTFFANINGTEIKFSGDYREFLDADIKENVLVILNHQTNVDWITTEMLTTQKNTTGRIRFMHKDELKYVPLFGTYFWVHGCINVARYGSFKESKTIAQLQYLEKHSVPTWLVIFPEGTRYNPENKKVIHKSQQFAESSGLKLLHNTLSPRTRGTYLALRELHTYFDTVYDITIAYESTRKYSPQDNDYKRIRAPAMAEFMQSFSPKLHVNIRRIDIGTVPHDDEERVRHWLHDLFERKDRLIENFIAHGKLEDKEHDYQPATRWRQTLPYSAFFLAATAAVLSTPMGRRVYLVSGFGGTLAGILWMRFH